jgi:hypothetical protein
MSGRSKRRRQRRPTSEATQTTINADVSYVMSDLVPTPSAARAHAIKTSLAVICAVNDLLAETSDAEVRERVERSRAAVRSIVSLVREEMRPEALGLRQCPVKETSRTSSAPSSPASRTAPNWGKWS